MRSVLRALAMMAFGLCTVVTTAASAAQDSRPPSERELRTAVSRAEKRFFEVYNRVNDDARHQMACQNEGRAGSRLRRSRSCRTQGESAISAEAAKEYLTGLNLAAAVDTDAVAGQQQAGMNRDFGGPVDQRPAVGTSGAEYADQAFSDAGGRMQAERAAFDKHLAALIDEHPELKQRLDEYLLAKSQYEAARRK